MVDKGVLKIALVGLGVVLGFVGASGFVGATGALGGTTGTEPFMDKMFWVAVWGAVLLSAGIPFRVASSMD